MKLTQIYSNTLLAWTPISLFILYSVLHAILQSAYPTIFCQAMNAGGKEYLCGYSYSASSAQFASIVFGVVYLGITILNTRHLFLRKLSKSGIVGVAINLSFIALFAIVWLYFGSEVSP